MSKSDPLIPVLVGAAAVQQRIDDPAQAREPLALMIAALEQAADDAGSRDLLRRASSVCAPRGFWAYPDPCRLIAGHFGADGARTAVAEIGVLQTTLFGRAARDIAAGRADIVLVAGGEARYRSRSAMRRGVVEQFTQQDTSVAPDEVLRPARDVLHDLEIARGVAMPVQQYAMIENALRAANGQSFAAHRDEVAALWARFSSVAADNPDAWNRIATDAATIRGGDGNRMLALPYTILHTSQWNVDQASAFILTSTATARRLGVAEDRWIYPHAVVDSNLMLALSERRDLHRCAGFARAGERVEQLTGTAIAAAEHLELYSCFPSAVRLQMREMGIAGERQVTVTGGMTFAGGPLNNFMLQALARMTAILRADPGSRGAVTAVSGILTKQGVSLWSATPPARPFAFDDVSDATARDARSVPVVDGATGVATVATYTVLTPGDGGRLVALLDLPGGARTIAATTDSELVDYATRVELCGRRAEIDGDRLLRVQ